MDAEINNTKRKKRKTRKCLNEIRKRSRQYGCCATKEHVCETHVKKLKKTIPKNNLLTSNRLTLSLFPKAVRSETITRSVLAKIKRERNINLNNIVNNKIPSPVFNKSDDDAVQVKNDLKEINSSDTLYDNEVTHDNNSDGRESPFGNFVLYSPVYKNKESGISSSDDIELNAEQRTEVLDDHLRLYESLVKEIPIFLSKNFPAELLSREIVQKKMKAQLDKIKESSNISTSVSNKWNNNIIIENPIECLRMSQEDCVDVIDLNSPGSANSNASMNSPLVIKTPSILQETPEYDYYPHKLNH